MTKRQAVRTELRWLLPAARERLDTMLETLRGYVSHETPTSAAAELDDFAHRVAERFRALGAIPRAVRGEWGTHLVLDVPGRGERADGAPVLLVGHTDTVWPLGTLRSMPWRLENGVVHGPGVYDMKSGIVVMEEALRLLHSRDCSHPPVRIALVADEEIGSPSSRDLLIEAAEGAVAVLGFESPHPDGALKSGRMGSTRLEIAVVGRAAHAALDPGQGVSAIDELVDQLGEVRRAVSEAQERFPDAVLCNVGTVEGGGRTNVVPASARAEIGLRFRSPAAEEHVLQRLHALAARRTRARVEVRVLSSRPAWEPGEHSGALAVLVEDAAEALGLDPVGARPAAGAGDTNLLGSAGYPTLDGFGPVGAGAHAPHEHVRTASLPERVALVATLLANL